MRSEVDNTKLVMPKVTVAEDVFCAWTNSDLTEGRGEQFVIYVCRKKATAIRMGRKESVQGSDCPVTKEKALYIDGAWYTPAARVHAPTEADLKAEKRFDAKDRAVAKAVRAGLSLADLQAMGVNP